MNPLERQMGQTRFAIRVRHDAWRMPAERAPLLRALDVSQVIQIFLDEHDVRIVVFEVGLEKPIRVAEVGLETVSC